MKAKSLLKERRILSETSFLDLVVWQLPQSVAGSTHLFKYRLAFVVEGVCIIRYDNEAGKGNHNIWANVKCRTRSMDSGSWSMIFWQT
jgi:hypothetical protein